MYLFYLVRNKYYDRISVFKYTESDNNLKGEIMEKVIRNMNFKPLLEEVEYEKLDPPTNNSTINMRVWDEIKVERLRSDAVKVLLKRNVKPEPKCILKLEVTMGLEVIVDANEYDKLDDAEEYFKNSQVLRVLASTVAVVISNITLHSPIGPMITAPVAQLPQ